MARHGGAALEAPAEKTFGILDAARPKIRAQQRLLEDVALGSAAAHAHDLLENRLDETDRLGIVAPRIGGHALGDVGDDGAGGLAPLTLHAPQLCEPALDRSVLGRGKDRVAKSRISLQGSSGGPTPQIWQRHRNALLSATAPVAAERATPGRMLSS